MFRDNFKINLSNILNAGKKNESFFWMKVDKILKKLSWKIHFANFNHITLFITFPCLI